jgi:hypothetical protein
LALENRALRRKFGPKRDCIMRSFIILYYSENIMGAIKSSRMRWLGM